MFVLVARLTVKAILFYSSFPIDIELFKVVFAWVYICFDTLCWKFDLIFDPLEVVGQVAGIIETKITQFYINLRIL